MFSFKIDAMHSRFFELPLSPSLCTPASYLEVFRPLLHTYCDIYISVFQPVAFRSLSVFQLVAFSSLCRPQKI